MKAAIYGGKETIEIKDIPIPKVGENDVLLQNIYSSICGTDVAVFEHGPGTGHKITVGQEFGHETISRVVAVGSKVTDFKVGERVYPYPRLVTGDSKRAGTIGGFSEYILAPNAKRDITLYEVDETITDKMACLIEPFTVGCRAARRSQPKPGEKAVVFGCGTIGIAAAIALCYFGIEQVMICDRSDYRLKIAKDMGFTVCNTAREDFEQVAKSYFGMAPSLNGLVADIDCFIDAAGAEKILQIFMDFGKIESRFVSVAVNNAIRDLDLLHMTYAQKSIIGSGGYMPEDVRDVMEIMKSKRWDIESIITHEYPLEKIEDAIRKASDSNQAFNVMISLNTERGKKDGRKTVY
nr:alcohol dehydrogenase catalytic domain-containing protein [uncultured Cellulosilyticum sp.]